jgi:hypothetical protein
MTELLPAIIGRAEIIADARARRAGADRGIRRTRVALLSGTLRSDNPQGRVHAEPPALVRLREKDGKAHAMPCHHRSEGAAVLHHRARHRAVDAHAPALGRCPCDDGRRAAAGIATKLGNHSFRVTGITAYLKNGDTLEKAASMANHASTRTTQLYDRRREELRFDEVERIRVVIAHGS